MNRLLVVGALVVAGCGSDKTADFAAQQTTPSAPTTVATAVTTTTTTTLVPTTTRRTATVQQYASIIAKYDTDLRKYTAQASPCFSGPCSIASAITVTTLVFTNETFILDLAAAVDPAGRNFIGDPPREILPLYLATADAALAVKSAKLLDCDSKGCTNGPAVRSATSELIRQLDGWKPYI